MDSHQRDCLFDADTLQLAARSFIVVICFASERFYLLARFLGFNRKLKIDLYGYLVYFKTSFKIWYIFSPRNRIMSNKLRFQPLGFLGYYISCVYKFAKDIIKSADNSIFVYLVVIFVITLLRRFLPGFVLPIAALLFFSAPYLMKSKVTGLKWNLNGVLLGVAVSVVILSIYVVIVNKPIKLGKISYILLMLQLFLVSLPEEVFF